MSPNILRRTGALVLSGAVAVGLTLTGPAAHAATDTDPVAKGTAWIQGQLKSDGLLHAAYDGGSGPVGYADYGSTVELAYALDALGRTGKLPAITAGLEASVDSYITGADFGAAGDQYAGPTGKLLAFASDLGVDADPTSFGGTDLVARMESLTTDSGRIADAGSGDYANVFGQMWAARGLLDVGSSEASAAVSYLLTQQCSDGHFLSFFGDSCDTTAPGPDAAAFAVILLHDKTSGDPALATALGKATDWLASAQAANGSFSDDNGIPNADSTGLSAWALRLEGRAGAARKAAVWLRTLQVPGAACDGKLAGDRGAIAYDPGAYKAGRTDGIGRLEVGQWQTVAAQALPALQSAPARPGGVSLEVPAHVRAGGKAAVTVGLAPGERACVGIGNAPQKTVVAPADGASVTVKVAVPKATGRVLVKLHTVAGTVGAATIVR